LAHTPHNIPFGFLGGFDGRPNLPLLSA